VSKELKHIVIAISAIVCALVLPRCANRLTPQGGPRDSLSPVVRIMLPENEGRHFTARRIFIEFDEYVQLKDQTKEFFTSPLMKVNPSLKVRGKGVRIDIKDTLLENQTYSLNFGTSIVDNNESNPLYGLRYVFSTGAAIDSMLMTGYTADAMKGDSVSKTLIFFYDAAKFDSMLLPGFDTLMVDSLLPKGDSLLTDSLLPGLDSLLVDSLMPAADTLLPDSLRMDSIALPVPDSLAAPDSLAPQKSDSLATPDGLALDTLPKPRVPRYYNTATYDSLLLLGKPSAVGRAEGNGIFIAQNLKDIPYRIYALEDTNSNLQYDPGVDKVGFLDSLYNPADQDPVTIWLDQWRHYPTADPQLYFRMFTEPSAARQNLTLAERPSRHQAVLQFNAPWPQIDTLTFDSIPEHKIIREYQTADRDTISLWFDMPPEALGDTIKGRLSYRRPDSLGVMAPTSQALNLVWRKIETREEEREREREEKAMEEALENGEEYTPPEKPNPFKFKVDAGAEVNPEKSIPIEFDLPLVAIDSARIELVTVPDLGDPAPVPFRLERDTMNIRRWVISSDWDERHAYRLTINKGVFTNIAGESNDSLGANFKIAQRAKFATLIVNLEGKTPESKYILQVVNESGKNEREIKEATTGEYTFYYLPEGSVSVRLTEDGNGNGKWDTGILTERRQPERTEFYVGATGDRLIPLKPGWDARAEVDAAEIFAPISMEKIRLDLQRAEDARVVKYLEDKAIKDEERRRQEAQGQGGGGLGIGSALGGAKSQIQSGVGAMGGAGGMGGMGGMGGGNYGGGMY
jgi:hypothetical protein